MPGSKSTIVNGPSSIARGRAGDVYKSVTGTGPLPYKVDKDLGKFYYLINRTSKQHVRKEWYFFEKEWILFLKRTFRQD
jgi:hypothetical protein